MSSHEVTFARESIAALLARYDGAEAWDALEDEGWLDVLPCDAQWEQVDFVAAALDVIGAEAREIAYAPHIGAAATLAEAGAELPRRPLALALDQACSGDRARVRLWGDGLAESAVIDLGKDGLGVIASSAWELPGLVDELLAPVMVSWADVDLSAATPLETDPAAAARHRARVAYLLAAEAAGAMRAATSATVDYLKSRRAFGVNLSSFQALQHRAVDIYTAGVLADAVVSGATDRLRAGDDAAYASWAAKAFVGDRGTWAIENAIQLHGGIGFTWEIGLHLGLRRTQRARLIGGEVQRTAQQLLASRSAARGPLMAAVTDWSKRGAPQEVAAR